MSSNFFWICCVKKHKYPTELIFGMENFPCLLRDENIDKDVTENVFEVSSSCVAGTLSSFQECQVRSFVK